MNIRIPTSLGRRLQMRRYCACDEGKSWTWFRPLGLIRIRLWWLE